ncbi:Tigger transposable element-derived protein 1-like 170 [Homarus americanus]|uniref:Tigger transposable element-derived protein 1-like 170 n=1 Tax=Homarus americanus TaxID=6706 RepID=A0A8J5KG93_HOMAM|nr:Tigger transposable element-derived protein 1-like 170 [Homarus americanus]
MLRLRIKTSGGGQYPLTEHVTGESTLHDLLLAIQHLTTIPPQQQKILTAWKEVTVRCLCAAWRPLWPECVLQRDFEGFEELEEEAVVHEIVSLGNSMGLEVDDDDVEELVEEHSKELSTEELLELHKEENETLKRSLTSEESGEEEDKEESRIIPAKDLKDAFFCWSKLSKLAEDYHPDVGSVQKAIRFPPKPITGNPDMTLNSIGIQNGEVLIVEDVDPSSNMVK